MLDDAENVSYSLFINLISLKTFYTILPDLNGSFRLLKMEICP